MSKQKLLSLTKKDFKIETFKAGGKGGQHQNKTDSAVRITHIATGISAESREHRSQSQNKKEAFRKLTSNKEFQKWLKIESMRVAGIMKTEEQLKKEVDELIERDLRNGNIVIE